MTLTQPRLALYVVKHCMGCDTALEFARRAAERFPHWQIDVVDLGLEDVAAPATVIGTPTWVANGQVIFRGNPAWRELEAAMQAHGGSTDSLVDLEAPTHG